VNGIMGLKRNRRLVEPTIGLHGLHYSKRLKPTTRTSPIHTNIVKHLHPKIRKQRVESLLSQ
jgi:hypothetical protein